MKLNIMIFSSIVIAFNNIQYHVSFNMQSNDRYFQNKL